MTEQVEAFTTDSSGYTTDTVEHDSAGNLTYDGSQAYTYDAWNRMISVAHAYKDSSGTLHAGQVFQLNSYDTKSRRVIKAVSSTGQHDCTY